MARASREEADKHREEVVGAAARLFRERGIGGVSVPELMGEAGLTHGGFYRHFKSKDDLAALACSAAFAELAATIAAIDARHQGDGEAAERELLETYLSAAHRDDPGSGCPTAALCGDVARETKGSALRNAYAKGVHGMVDNLAKLGIGKNRSQDHAKALAELSTMVGALVLARATRGDKLSGEILDAARKSLLSSTKARPGSARKRRSS